MNVTSKMLAPFFAIKKAAPLIHYKMSGAAFWVLGIWGFT